MKTKEKWYQVALVMLPILAMFYWINSCTAFSGDDFKYQVGIHSISDIISFQYNHYFEWGGRVIIHGILQVFVALCDKSIFDIFNTLVFVLFTYLTIAITDKTLVRNPFAWGSVAIGVAFFLPAHAEFYKNGAFAINYLWGITLCLLFVYIWKYYKCKSWGYTLLLFLPCFIMGWSQELFALPIAGALCVYYLIYRKEIFTQRAFLSFAFCLGVLILVVAPGNFVRLGEGGMGLSDLLKLVLRISSSQLPLILLTVTICALYKIRLQDVFVMLKANLLYSLIFLISFIFCFVFPSTGTRTLMGFAYWWIIILAIIFLSRERNVIIYKYVYGVLYIVMIFFAVLVGYYSNINSVYLRNVVSKFIESDKGIVFINAPKYPLIIKSSIADVSRDDNKRYMGSLYGGVSKERLFLVNESIDETIDELISQINEVDSLPMFYNTDMPDYYILRNYEKYGDDLVITYSGADSDAKIVKMVLEKVTPSRYLSFDNKLKSGDLVYFDYNGERVGIMFNPYDTRKVIAITPQIKEN